MKKDQKKNAQDAETYPMVDELNSLMSQHAEGLELKAKQEAGLSDTIQRLNRIYGGIVTLKKLIDSTGEKTK